MYTFKKSAMKYKDANGVMQDVGAMCSVNETDTTLTKSGVAADAKTIGNKINDLTSEKVDKSYIITVFEELKTAIQNGETEAAVAVLDNAILDLSILA